MFRHTGIKKALPFRKTLLYIDKLFLLFTSRIQQQGISCGDLFFIRIPSHMDL